MGPANVGNKTRGTLRPHERETNTTEEHLGEGSHKIHTNSWPRLLGLLSPKLGVVHYTANHNTCYNLLWFSNDKNKFQHQAKCLDYDICKSFWVCCQQSAQDNAISAFYRNNLTSSLKKHSG